MVEGIGSMRNGFYFIQVWDLDKGCLNFIVFLVLIFININI